MTTNAAPRHPDASSSFASAVARHGRQLNPRRLDERQREAVRHRGGPLLVIGAAGTGKTTTLAARAGSLIDDGVDPSRILVLAFTRRAAVALVDGVAEQVGSRAQRMWAGSFHGVADRLLRRYGSAGGLAPGFTVIDQADQVDLLARARTEVGVGADRRVPAAAELARLLDASVTTATPLSGLLAGDGDGREAASPADPVGAVDDLRAVFGAYTAHKRRSQLLDYGDLLLFWRALTLSPVGEALRCLFDHVLIDEYQDTNPIQADIVAGMVGPGVEVCAAGDDGQAIYGFRSATVANLHQFPHRFGGTRVIALDHQHRFAPGIGALAAAMADPGATESHPGFDPTVVAPAVAGSEWPARPRLVGCVDEDEEAEVVVDAVLDAARRGLALQDQAVLFRAGHHADGVELELMRRAVPYRKIGGVKYLESAHVKDLLCLLRLVDNPADEPAWQRVLSCLNGVDPERARRLSAGLRVGKPDADPVARFIDGFGTVPAVAALQANELRSALRDCRGRDLSPAEKIDRMIPVCLLVFPNRYDNAPARVADLDRLVVAARRYDSSSRLVSDLTLDPPARIGDRALAPRADDDVLTLCTIHSSKGHEWPAAYLIGASDENLPSARASADVDTLAAEQRLARVAVTRAREQLMVTFVVGPEARGHEATTRRLSRFLRPFLDFFDVVPLDGDRPEPEVRAVDLATVGVADDVDAVLDALWR